MGSSPSRDKVLALTTFNRKSANSSSSNDAESLAHVAIWLQRLVNSTIVVVFGKETEEASRAVCKLFECQYRLTSAEFLFVDVDPKRSSARSLPGDDAVPKQLNDYFRSETGDYDLPKIYIGTAYVGGIEATLQAAASGLLYDQMKLWGCSLRSHDSIDTEILDLNE